MSEPAYLDVPGQQFADNQIFLGDIRIDHSITTGLRINHSGGGEDFDAMISPEYDVTSDARPLMFVRDLGAGGGSLSLSGISGTGFTADRVQRLQDQDGYFALTPAYGPQGVSPVMHISAAVDPAPVGGIGFVSRTAQAAAIAATNLTDSTGAGLYEVSYYASTTTANALDGTIAVRLDYTDRNGATSQTAPVPLSLAALSTGTTAHKGVLVAYLASGNIQYSTVLTGAQTTSLYALEVRCKYLG